MENLFYISEKFFYSLLRQLDVLDSLDGDGDGDGLAENRHYCEQP